MKPCAKSNQPRSAGGHEFGVSPARRFVKVWSGLIIVGLALELGSFAAVEAAPAGQFYRLHWYERGLTNGNPKFERRFRVNAPETSLHPTFGQRLEARENGTALILAEEDLFQLRGAELYLELWGGHPGTANKRVTVNGRSTYPLPLVGTEEKHCTHSYPSIPLQLTDLVNGWNTFQFACDQGSTFWGHFIVDNVCLRVALTNGHPELRQARLAGFVAQVKAAPAVDQPETIELVLASTDLLRITSVDFQGFYEGYDENGNRQTSDWHGFTKNRRAEAHLGSVTNVFPSPFRASSGPALRLRWSTAMLPAQSNMAVRAVVHFTDQTNLVYVTGAATGLPTPVRPDRRVRLLTSADLPQPFWSRANQKKTCTIPLDCAPADIERAELHVVIWDGGAGTVKNHFLFNGHSLPLASGRSAHDVIYRRLAIDPAWLRPGPNQIELLSDTEHHGIEVLRPGPALMVRTKVAH